MAPPPGQTNRDTSAADHTTCFYCHQQLILVSHKVIVSRDAHGCSIRICEPCEKEARRRRPVRFGFLWSRRRRADDRSRLRGVPVVSTFRRSPRRAPYASPTQVKVEKKDEGIEAMRKLMGGAADEDEEEAG